MTTKVKTLDRTHLVGEWLLDGSWTDSSGNWNNGTLTNVTFTDTFRGYQSQCGVFNWSSSKITITDTPILKPTWPFTIWIRVNTSSSANQGFFQSWSQLWWWAWVLAWIRLWIDASASPVLIFDIWKNTWAVENVDWKQLTIASSIVTDGKPHFIEAKYDWTKMYLIVDNKEQANVSWTWNPWYNATNYIRIWCLNNNGTDLFYWTVWTIQTVRLDNVATNEKEHQTRYQEGLRQLSWQWYGSLFDWLVAQYDFQWDAQDVIGGNNGTVTGTTLTIDRFGIANSAYSFNGSGDYIDFVNPSLTELTYSVWLRINNTSKTNHFPLFWCWGSWWLYFSYNHLTSWQLTVWNYYAWSWDRKIDCWSLTQWQYYNLVLTRDAAWNWIVYKDWIQIASWSLWSIGTSITWAIWWSSWLFAEYIIDNAEIYNKAKTPEEVKLLYQLSSTTPNLLPWKSNFPTSLQNWLKLWLNEQGRDLSWNGNHWTLVNWPTVARRIGEKGLDYNGSNQYTNLPSILTPTWDFTFSLWTLATNNSQTWDKMLIINQFNTTAVGHAIRYSNNTAWFWGLVDITAGYNHIVLTYSSSAGYILYLNSKVFATSSATTTFSDPNSENKIWAYSSNYYNWKITNPIILNRALSPQEVEADFYATFIK